MGTIEVTLMLSIVLQVTCLSDLSPPATSNVGDRSCSSYIDHALVLDVIDVVLNNQPTVAVLVMKLARLACSLAIRTLPPKRAAPNACHILVSVASVHHQPRTASWPGLVIPAEKVENARECTWKLLLCTRALNSGLVCQFCL